MTDANSEETRAKWQAEDDELEILLGRLRQLGVHKLAHEISEERFARRVFESRMLYDYYSVQEAIWADRSNRALEDAVKAQSLLFDKAAAYNNVVSTLGYAGFFGIWTIVAPSLQASANAFVALMLGFSLAVFVWSTISTSIRLAFNSRRFAIIAGSDFKTHDEEIQAHRNAEDKINRANLIAQKQWPYIFSASILPAVVAGFYLFGEFILQIVGVDYTFFDKLVGVKHYISSLFS